MISIDINKTTGEKCSACVNICYARVVFEMKNDGPRVIHPDKCRLCGHCLAVCVNDL